MDRLADCACGTYGNGIVHTMAQNARQLPASSIDTGGALSQQFVYDKNGNVTGVTDALDPARSKAMVYDGLDRLTSASGTVFGGTGVHQFAYDPLDNLRSWTLGGVKDQSNYVYGADNRLSQIKDTGGNVVHAFGYDPQGNVATRNGVVHDFDYGNRLRSVGATESYLYDGHGRRVQTTQSGGSVTRWMYASSGQMLFSAKGPSNPTAHENVYLAGSLVAIIDRDGPSNAVTATTYQHTDALGSPVAMSNEAGAIIERTNYDPYGGPIGKTVNGLGYTGHVMDGATGLTYMQQRYYDPAIGRFLSVDPIPTRENGDNFNRYWYANNNPYKFVDPNGEDSFLASRPTKVYGGASHNYIATNARYVGDPSATIHSYGNRGNDMAGKVNRATPGMSEGTYEADVAHWASLSLDLASKNASKIDAPDDVVDQIADSVSPTVPYSPTPELTPATDINSNSIASAVAEKAAGKEVPVNQESRISPGKDQKHLVKFKKADE